MARDGRGRRQRLSIAVIATLAVASAMALLAVPARASDGVLDRGFGVEKPGNDALQMDVRPPATQNHWDPTASGTGVSDYLDHEKADWVHVGIGWCQLQSSANDFNMAKINTIVRYVQQAHHELKDTVLTLVPKAPVFTRYYLLRRDRMGNSWTGDGCAVAKTPSGQPEPTYPTGDWAPDFVTAQAANTSMANYLRTASILRKCLAGVGYTDSDLDNCPARSGPDADLTPYVMVQLGAEQNNENSWQNGICGSDTNSQGQAWYDSADNKCGSTRENCQSSSPPSNCDGAGTVRKIDAEFNFDFMNYVGDQAQTAAWFKTIMGGPWFHKAAAGWGGSFASGDAYLGQELKRVNNACAQGATFLCGWTEADGRHFTELSMQFGSCRNSQWNQWMGCDGSVREHLDGAQSVMASYGVNKPIAITGLFVPRNGDQTTQSANYKHIYNGIRTTQYCRASDPRPVSLIIFARLVDSNPLDTQEHQFPDIGFMKPTDFEKGGTYDRDPIWPYNGTQTYADFSAIPLGCS
jgi:hypothetical protein